MKMIKGLTKANAGKYSIEVREDLDFSDDGSRFKGFSYKGIPMTQCRYDGDCYLSIRVDYIMRECSFTYDEWKATKESDLTDEFNGVPEFDIDKLIENLETIRKKVDELNKKTHDEVIDMRPVANKLKEEIEFATAEINNFKLNYRWYEAGKYSLELIAGYTRSADKMVRYAKDVLAMIDVLTRQDKKEYVERLEKYGYVKIAENDFYLREMREALEKQEGKGV